MTVLDDSKVLVLRHPEPQGNFKYWMAELSKDQACRLKERIARGEVVPLQFEIGHIFGDSLTLNQIMQRLQSRDFQVLDYPVAH